MAGLSSYKNYYDDDEENPDNQLAGTRGSSSDSGGQLGSPWLSQIGGGQSNPSTASTSSLPSSSDITGEDRPDSFPSLNSIAYGDANTRPRSLGFDTNQAFNNATRKPDMLPPSDEAMHIYNNHAANDTPYQANLSPTNAAIMQVGGDKFPRRTAKGVLLDTLKGSLMGLATGQGVLRGAIGGATGAYRQQAWDSNIEDITKQHQEQNELQGNIAQQKMQQQAIDSQSQARLNRAQNDNDKTALASI